MVRISRQAQTGNDQLIEVLSNLSLSLDRLAGFFLMLSAVTLLVALWPTVMGYWPIMAIALIHLAIVGICFRMAWRGNWARQTVRIGGGSVRIEVRTACEQHEVDWPANWVRVEVVKDRREPRVNLCLHGERVEIGRFVPPDERLQAAELLRNALAPYSAWDNTNSRPIASSG